MVGTTKSLGAKHTLDKFYTKPELAKDLLNLLNIEQYHTIIEPSAGGGAFSQFIQGVLAFDLEPECEGIIKQDYLKLDIHDYKIDTNKPILVVGNPPFGTAGNLALDFIKHSATFADTIAFILPLSFAKDSMINKIPRNFHLKTELVGKRGKILEEDSFTLNGEDYPVPCVFQVWERRGYLREIKKPKTKTELFDFVTNVEESDCRIQRVGGNAGLAFSDRRGATQSNYYIRLNDSILEKFNLDSVQEFIRLVNRLTFETVGLTVGPRSLSKTELITTLEREIVKQNNTLLQDM